MFTLKSSQITLASPIFAELCPYYSLFYNQISFPTKIISPRVPSTGKAGKPCLVWLVWGPYSVPLPFPGGALFGQWRSTRSYLGRGHAILLRFAFETHRPLSCKKKPWSSMINRERSGKGSWECWPSPFVLPHRAEVHNWRVELGFVPHLWLRRLHLLSYRMPFSYRAESVLSGTRRPRPARCICWHWDWGWLDPGPLLPSLSFSYFSC